VECCCLRSYVVVVSYPSATAALMTKLKPVQRHTEAKTILVVGDWLVDEHWVTGVHRSRTSSRVGAHYRTLQDRESTVTSFFGAGRTAAILHRARFGDYHDPFKLIGLGVWHQADTSVLEAMFEPAFLKGRTPHQINLPQTKVPKHPQLINLVHDPRIDQRPGTTRVIRLYTQTGSQVELLERIDWEVKVPEGGWISQDDLETHAELRRVLENTRPDAVLVKDLLKGVITDDLIYFLASKLRHVSWYISSKMYRPDWLRHIEKDSIRLLEIPQAAAQGALDKPPDQGGLDAWLTRNGKPSKAALSSLETLGEEFPKALIVAVPSDQTTLAYRRSSPENPNLKEGVCWVSPQASPLSVGLPMASVCFAAFTAYLLLKPSLGLAQLVDLSLSFTEDWRTNEAGRVESPVGWDAAREPRLDLSVKARSGNGGFRCPALDWPKERKEWDLAYKDRGVIADATGRRIELWRAMTEVKNYVCVASSKRKVVRDVVHEIEAFKRERGTRSCMLIAPPGSGKSLLAQLLAEDHGLHFLEFNITQMISKTDILDCFDLILTTQFENRGKRLLVFVDEIDAPLGGDAVYDAFLTPLERGVYRRAGKTFPIEPCFWLFAGTKAPEATARKASDFESRLTLKPLHLTPAPDENHNRLENVYLGVAMLRAEFPDVREVSSHVLDLFHQLEATISIRQFRQFIKDFVDIKSGEVRYANVPRSWLSRLGVEALIQQQAKEFMVEVKGQTVSPDVIARFTPASVKFRAAAS
jgi:hypothetical protein